MRIKLKRIKRIYKQKNKESEDQDKYLEAEEDINKYELYYLDEDIQINDYNPFN